MHGGRQRRQCYPEEEGLRGMDLAEEDWEGHEEGANEISPGGTFSYVALALPPGRITSSAS